MWKAVARSCVGISFATTMLSGCGAQDVSQTKDIYVNDQQTRHAASAAEIVWTVFAVRQTSQTISLCTASLLSDSYLITANHCGTSRGDHFQSGSAILHGLKSDIEITGIVEANSGSDYAIASIAWTGGAMPTDQRKTPAVAKVASDVTTGVDGVGTALTTVGFPADKNQNYPTNWQAKAETANGYAKKQSGGQLYYDIGVTNGNSGGAVWRASDHMLVSLTNGGSHDYGDNGWDGNDPEDASEWNYGPALSAVYSDSAVLKKLYP